MTIAVITIARPPVNSLNHSTRHALLTELTRALGDRAVEAIVIWGGPDVFSAGADIEEFAAGLDGPIYAAPSLPTLVKALDSAGKCVVAAIAGPCLGGGLELALACHARVCTGNAKFGLPEVKLGIIPGAGGTQRLPRLIGVEPALQLILSGSIIDAARAEKLGVARRVTGDLLEAAREEARALIGKPLARVSDLPARLREADNAGRYFNEQRAALRKPLPAPLACIDAVAATLTEPVSQGSDLETALFRHLVQTPESKALCYAFFSDRAAGKAPPLPPGLAERSITRVGIVGAGTMGSGIAICCLDAGLPVTLVDTTPAIAARIEAHYEQLKKERPPRCCRSRRSPAAPCDCCRVRAARQLRPGHRGSVRRHVCQTAGLPRTRCDTATGSPPRFQHLDARPEPHRRSYASPTGCCRPALLQPR